MAAPRRPTPLSPAPRTKRVAAKESEPRKASLGDSGDLPERTAALEQDLNNFRKEIEKHYATKFWVLCSAATALLALAVAYLRG